MRIERALVAYQKTVTAAGTAEALEASTKLVYKVKLKALSTNTDLVYVGDSTVAAATGFSLAAGVELSLTDLIGSSEDVMDLSKIYIDSAVSGEGVSVVYFS